MMVNRETKESLDHQDQLENRVYEASLGREADLVLSEFQVYRVPRVHQAQKATREPWDLQVPPDRLEPRDLWALLDHQDQSDLRASQGLKANRACQACQDRSDLQVSTD